MEIRVKITPNKKKELVEILKDGRYGICVNADRKNGAANERMREVLANHFRTSKDKVILISGHTSSTKMVKILP